MQRGWYRTHGGRGDLNTRVYLMVVRVSVELVDPAHREVEAFLGGEGGQERVLDWWLWWYWDTAWRTS